MRQNLCWPTNGTQNQKKDVYNSPTAQTTQGEATQGMEEQALHTETKMTRIRSRIETSHDSNQAKALDEENPLGTANKEHND